MLYSESNTLSKIYIRSPCNWCTCLSLSFSFVATLSYIMCKSFYLYARERSLLGELKASLFPTYSTVFRILFNPLFYSKYFYFVYSIEDYKNNNMIKVINW